MELKGILIESNGKTFEITMDEAEKLYNELHKMFGRKSIQYVPYTEPYKPYYPITYYQWSGKLTGDSSNV